MLSCYTGINSKYAEELDLKMIPDNKRSRESPHRNAVYRDMVPQKRPSIEGQTKQEHHQAEKAMVGRNNSPRIYCTRDVFSSNSPSTLEARQVAQKIYTVLDSLVWIYSLPGMMNITSLHHLSATASVEPLVEK